MALLLRCLMEVRAVMGEVDPPPRPGIDASTGSRSAEVAPSGVSGRFAPQVARASFLGAANFRSSASPASRVRAAEQNC